MSDWLHIAGVVLLWVFGALYLFAVLMGLVACVILTKNRWWSWQRWQRARKAQHENETEAQP